MKPIRKIPIPISTTHTLPPRDDHAHKGRVGRILIVAGSRGMSGAACLSAAGALRGGAGLVRVLAPASVQPLVAAGDPCLMSVPLPETRTGTIDDKRCRKLLAKAFEWATVTALGPGLGQHHSLRDFVRFTLQKYPGPLVVDADGLNNIAALGYDVWKSRAGKKTVITPHPGEFSRLRNDAKLDEAMSYDDDVRLRAAYEFAVDTGVVVVLKGHRTVVADTTRTYVNTTGNPGMATGGMGDVLTGFIAAIIGQGLEAFEAACLAVKAHGLAGDLCAKNIGPIGMLARDVAEALPAALAQVAVKRMGFKS